MMGYLETVKIITNILFTLFGLIMAHFFVFALVGVFKRKTYPETDKKNRYGLIIPARNEEAVVAGLIESIYKNNYPQDKLQIFVIAHNCDDKTAETARALGATVYEYNNDSENTMGYAFRYLFSCIERDYGTRNFDGFFLFNADNLLDKDYISRMNDAFEYYNGKSVITSYRNSKNFGSNLISGLYGIYFSIGCRLESCGRTVLGCSTRVQGTGYLINSDIVKDGWPYYSLAEDWEFTADQILLGNNIRYCDDAIFYDEQPTSVHIMWRQRVRWSRGHLIVFMTRIRNLLTAVFRKGTAHRGSHYDFMTNVLPVTLFWLLLQIIQILLLLIAPIVDDTASYREIFFGNSGDLLSSDGFIFEWIRSFFTFYVSTMLGAVVVFVLDRKRIKNVGILKMITISLCWPFFVLIQFPIDIQALFSKNLGWKPVPHSDQTSFEHVNAPVEEAR